MYDQNRAKTLLIHYLKTLFQELGVQWDNDNDVEVAAIVDHIVAAAVRRIEAQELDAIQP
jgi:hypothetical protein